MTDRSPAPDAAPDDAAPDDAAPVNDRALTNRWWWQGAVAAATGVVVIVWQWNAIGSGEGIVANWVMVALGVAAVVAGAVMAWHDRPRGPLEDDEDA